MELLGILLPATVGASGAQEGAKLPPRPSPVFLTGSHQQGEGETELPVSPFGTEVV